MKYRSLFFLFLIAIVPDAQMFAKPFVYSTLGFCLSCEQSTTFIARNPWFRDHYRCSLCRSLPRERAIMHVIQTLYPHYQELEIHESSPAFRSTSKLLKNKCNKYTYSYFVDTMPLGSYLTDYNCPNQNLGQTTFPDNSFDIIITQDVLEHVFDIKSVFAEIARILKVGGSHIFTTPLVNKQKATVSRAHLENNAIVYDLNPHYHGNPIDNQGSLVTYDFGYDIAEFTPSNCFFSIYFIENPSLGIEKTEYNEVCVMTKIK